MLERVGIFAAMFVAVQSVGSVLRLKSRGFRWWHILAQGLAAVPVGVLAWRNHWIWVALILLVLMFLFPVIAGRDTLEWGIREQQAERKGDGDSAS